MGALLEVATATPVSVANGGTGTAVAPTSGQILVGNAGGTAYAPQSLSGDVTVTNLGVTAIGALRVTNAMIAANTIDVTAKLTGVLPAAQFPALTGDITTSAGALATTLKNTGPGVLAATYASVTIDAQGRVTALASGATPATSLQTAYNGGATIVVTAANPASIANATNVTSNLLKLQELNLATNGDLGIAYTKTGAPTGATTFTGSAFDVQDTPTVTNSFTDNGVMLNLNYAPVAGAGTLAGAKTGFAVAVTPTAATAATGGTITMGANATGNALTLTHNNASATALAVLSIAQLANTGADTALKAAIAIDSQATLGRVIDCAVANTAQATGIWSLRYRAATTFTAPVTGLNINLDPTTSAANVAVSGMKVILDGGNTAGTDPSSASYCATFDYRSVNGTAANNGIVNVEVGEARTLSGQLVGIECDLATNITPGTNACIGMRILTPATSRAATDLEGSLVIDSQATVARVVDIATAKTSGTILNLRYRASTTLSGGTLLGSVMDFTTNVVGGNQKIVGMITYLAPAAAATSSAWIADYRVTAGSTNGCIFMQSNTNTTFTGEMTWLNIDSTSNITPGANLMRALKIAIPATTRADTAGEGVISISSTATAMRMIDCAVANTGAATGLWALRWGTVTSLLAPTTMLNLDGTTNLTATGQTLTCLKIALPSTATAASSGISITNAGSGAAINLGTQSAPDTLASGNIWHDSSQKTLSVTVAGITNNMVGCIATQTTDVNINTSSALTSLMTGTIVGTLTLPANFWTVGKSIKIIVKGKYGTKAATPGAVKITVQLGGTDIALNASSALTANQTAQFFKIETVITCRTTGGTGVMMGVGYCVLDAGLVPSVVGLPDQTATKNTAATMAVDVKWQFDTSDVANTVTAQIAAIEVLN